MSMATEGLGRISAALAIAEKYGTIDGEHHKAWVIDQMVRCLIGPASYQLWVEIHERIGEYKWDVGIPP